MHTEITNMRKFALRPPITCKVRRPKPGEQLRDHIVGDDNVLQEGERGECCGVEDFSRLVLMTCTDEPAPKCSAGKPSVRTLSVCRHTFYPSSMSVRNQEKLTSPSWQEARPSTSTDYEIFHSDNHI